MQVTETLSEGLKRGFKIVLPAKDIDRKVEDKLREYGSSARIPGFRPGKAPLSLLKTRFGEAMRGEVLQEAVNEGSHQAIHERGLRPAIQPKIEITSADVGADLAFTIEVEVLPEITPMDFKAIELERLDIQVQDKDIDEEVTRRAEMVKRTEPVKEPRPAKSGDVVVIDFEGQVDGKPLPGGKGDGFYLELGSGRFIPGFEDQLVGASAGEKRTVNVKFPDQYQNAEIQGKDAVFDVTVKEVREPIAAAIDDELAKQFGLENLAALKASVKSELENGYNAVARSRAKRLLFDKLSDGHDFPLPPGMVDAEFEGIWRQVQEDKAQGRLDAEDAKKSEDDLKADYRKIAERRIRLGLLLSDLGRKNNISVTPEETNRALIAEARRHPGNERQVMEFYSQNQAAAEALRAPILEDKVVDYIFELAKVTKKPMTTDEFKSMVEAEAAAAGAAGASATTAESEPADGEKAKKPAKRAAKKTKD